MSYFRLINERSVKRALQDVVKEIALQGNAHKYDEVLARNTKERKHQRFDGFNLFMSVGMAQPYKWFLAKPKVQIAEFLRVYETLAEYPLTQYDTPAEICARIYPKDSHERNIILKFKRPDQWLSPALLLAASAQHLGVEGTTLLEDGGVRMYLGDKILSVTPQGVFNNARHQDISFGDDFDAKNPITTFPQSSSDNPTLRTLYELSDFGERRYAVTLASLALDEQIINKAWLVKEITPMMRQAQDETGLSLRALQECDEILESGHEDLVTDLFAAAVPDLISYKALQLIVGAPGHIKPGRHFSKKTLRGWRQKLHEAYAEQSYANP